MSHYTCSECGERADGKSDHHSVCPGPLLHLGSVEQMIADAIAVERTRLAAILRRAAMNATFGGAWDALANAADEVEG